MEPKRTTIFKALLAIVPALLLALILQPASALAETHAARYTVAEGSTNYGYFVRKGTDDVQTQPFEEYVNTGESPVFGVWDSGMAIPCEVKAYTGYVFDYWTADQDLAYDDGVFSKGDHFSTAELLTVGIVVDTTFEAHFREATKYTVTYGHSGYFEEISPEEEEVVEGSCPTGPTTITPKQGEDGCEFGYWTANKVVTLTDGTEIAQGEKIKDAQLKKVKVTSAIAFVAHVKREAPYTVYYVTDGNGYISDDFGPSQTVFFSNSPTLPASMVHPFEDYEFDHWTADKAITLTDGTSIDAEKPLTHAQLLKVSVEDDITFIAHFKESTGHTVTYTTDGNGSIPSGEETEVVEENNKLTSIPTPTPNENYIFDHWTADVDVQLASGTTIEADTPLRTPGFWESCMGNILVKSDITFTAHFRSTTHKVTFVVDPSEGFLYPSGGPSTTDPVTIEVADGASVSDVKPSVFANDENTRWLGYWTADVDLKYKNNRGVQPAGTEILKTLGQPVITSDVTFTAHIVDRAQYTFTFITDGNGYFLQSDTPEKVVTTQYEQTTLKNVPTPAPYDSSKFAFDYWTADTKLCFYSPAGTDMYLAGDHISSLTTVRPLDQTYIGPATTLTAHFKQLKGNITYKTDGNGSVEPASEEITFSEKTIDSAGTKAMVGTPTGATAKPKDGYALDYWEASEDVIEPSDLSTIKAGDKIKKDQLSSIWITKDTNFTAHFKATATVTYTTDGNGTVDPTSEEVTFKEQRVDAQDTMAMAGTPSGATAKPKDGYVLDYWTASEDVINAVDSTNLPTISAGDQITNELMPGGLLITKNTTFTAHFIKVHTITYKAGEHGSVAPTSEEVRDGESPVGPTAITPDSGYAFVYWTANKDVKVADATQAIMLTGSEDDVAPQAATTTIKSGQPISAEQFAQIVMSDDVEFTAHFIRTPPYTVSYKTDGNGSVADEFETIENAFDSPLGTEVTANKGYEFDYWTASTDVQIMDEDGTTLITIAKGKKITDEQLKKVLVTDDITFTAHFKQTSVDPEPEPVNPDGGDTIKPADDKGGKLTPKTGDTLPGATAAVALGAGVVVAGAALLRKRHQ